VDDGDLTVRNATYGWFATTGRAPTVDDLAVALDRSVADVAASWRRLHDEHALVLHPGPLALRMAHPFSAVPTAFRVRTAGRWWYANCAWDAFGIGAALHDDGHVETSCPDCGEVIAVDVVDGRVGDGSLVFHCLVPAARWWDDIGFT
jgi:hypothetical protein